MQEKKIHDKNITMNKDVYNKNKVQFICIYSSLYAE